MSVPLLPIAQQGDASPATAILVFLLLAGVYIAVNGVIPALIAKSRGRHVWGWFFIGLCIGLVFALILVLVLPPVQDYGKYGTRTPRDSRGRAIRSAGRGHGRGRAHGAGAGTGAGRRRTAGRTPAARAIPSRLAGASPPPVPVAPPPLPATPPPVPTPEPEPEPELLLDGTYWVPTRDGNKGPFPAEKLRSLYAAGKLPLSLSVIEKESGLSVALADIVGGG